MHEAAFDAELGFEHLRGEVVMVEDELLPCESPNQGEGPVCLRWVTGVDNVEATTRLATLKERKKVASQAHENSARKPTLDLGENGIG